MTPMRFSTITRQVGLTAWATMLLLNGCSSFNETVENEKVAYKNVPVSKRTNLEVPPDLTQVLQDTRYAIQATNTTNAPVTTGPANFLGSGAIAKGAPLNTPNFRMERAGSQRWLVVKASPEQLYPKIKQFWADNGLNLETDLPELGIMQTDWAENRAKVPQDMIRKTLGKLFDSAYSNAERDRYRTRLERSANGETEIYISHRGLVEVYDSPQKERTVWQYRPVDPEMEAEFLSRLMTTLGGDAASVKAQLAPTNVIDKARVIKTADSAYVEIDDNFERAWRRIGLALDRSGFMVEERNRAKGIYFVRYVATNANLKDGNKDKGFFAGLFSSSSDKSPVESDKYRIEVVTAADKTRATAVLQPATDSKVKPSTTPEQILTILQDELK